MNLPIRLSSAVSLLNQYSDIVDSVVYGGVFGENQENQLLQQLESLLNSSIAVSEKMLNALGYTGSLESMEAQLSERIRQLSRETFFLNGPDLEEFILKKFTDIIAYDPKYSEVYKAYIEQVVEEYGIDKSSKTYLEALTKAVNEEFGHIMGNNTTIIITDKGTGYFSTNRDIKGRYSAKVSLDFYQTGSAIMRNIRDGFDKKKSVTLPPLLQETINLYTTDNDLNIDVEGEISFEKVLSLMKTRPSDLQKLPNFEQAKKLVNEYMINYISSQSSVSNKPLMEQCIREMVAQKDTLFFVGATAKGITGILGEIQGLYFIRSILNDNHIADNAASWIGGIKNPHADLILKNVAQEYFGIQVKNTSREEAIQEVDFEKFKTRMNKEMSGGNMSFDWFKETSQDFGKTLRQDPVLFDAVTGLLGMEQFNVPYLWANDKAYEVGMGENLAFAPVRQSIIDAASHAREAALSFVAGMMYMQLEPASTGSGDSNSLYLIGGTLAITSASILRDIINQLKDHILSFKIELSRVINEKAKKKSIGTIVEFLNAGSGNHLNTTQYVLQSSYTFFKG